MVSEIILLKEVPKNPIVIEGFPSSGLVGTIAARHMVEELDMDVIGYLESDKIPNVAIIHEFKPIHPIQIYSKGNLVLMSSELIMPFFFIAKISKCIRNWFDEISPSEIISLAGMSGIEEAKKEHRIFGIATSPKFKKKLDDLNVKMVREGILTGISSDLLFYCIEHNIPALSLMAETHNILDHVAAASLLKVLNGILDLNIETDNLIRDGEKVQEEIKKLSKQLKKERDRYREIEEFSPMYA